MEAEKAIIGRALSIPCVISYARETLFQSFGSSSCISPCRPHSVVAASWRHEVLKSGSPTRLWFGVEGSDNTVQYSIV